MIVLNSSSPVYGRPHQTSWVGGGEQQKARFFWSIFLSIIFPQEKHLPHWERHHWREGGRGAKEEVLGKERNAQEHLSGGLCKTGRLDQHEYCRSSFPRRRERWRRSERRWSRRRWISSLNSKLTSNLSRIRVCCALCNVFASFSSVITLQLLNIDVEGQI